MMKPKAVSDCWHRAWCDSRASSEAGSELPSVRSQLCVGGFVCECKMISFCLVFCHANVCYQDRIRPALHMDVLTQRAQFYLSQCLLLPG